MERCWYGKFSKTERCPEEGRYGNPDFHAAGRYRGLNATLRFLRASRWCAAHKHDGDRLIEPEDARRLDPRERAPDRWKTRRREGWHGVGERLARAATASDTPGVAVAGSARAARAPRFALEPAAPLGT